MMLIAVGRPGFMSMLDGMLERARPQRARLNARRRESVPASELVVAVQCGGSDAFSGVTGNPAAGICVELLACAGVTLVLSENTEVRDAVEQLTRRTPYGLAGCLVIQPVTRSDLARRWHDLMDIHAGEIADGQASIEQRGRAGLGWAMFRLIPEVANGRKKTWA